MLNTASQFKRISREKLTRFWTIRDNRLLKTTLITTSTNQVLTFETTVNEYGSKGRRFESEFGKDK